MRILVATLLAFTLFTAAAAAQDPVPTTGPASPVGANSATLTGSFTAGAPALASFEYGTTTAYGSTTPQQASPPALQPSRTGPHVSVARMPPTPLTPHVSVFAICILLRCPLLNCLRRSFWENSVSQTQVLIW